MRRPSIPNPAEDIGSLQRSVAALKEAVELLLGTRGSTGVRGGAADRPLGAITRQDVMECGSYEELRDKIKNGLL